MHGRTLAATLFAALSLGTAAAADGPKLPEVAAFDKLVVDALREVHNRGADLYNTSRDFEGAYRMYQGGLLAVKPLLAHRPAAQKLIDEGVEAADKEPTPARRAFKLHETIEAVRKSIKDANEPNIKTIDPEPKPKEKAPEPKPKPIDPIVDPKPTEKTPKDTEPKKAPEVKKTKEKDAEPKKGTGPSGTVTLKGKPVAAAEITLVSLGSGKPRVFTATVDDGKYQFAEAVPAGKYAVVVAGKGVPDKFQTTATTSLVMDLKAAAGTFDFSLE
jgi:outer membrane biosynthesis protein TonB